MVSQGHQTWSFNKPELGGIQNIRSVFHSARNGFPTGIFKRLEASLPEYPRKFPGLRTQPGAVVFPPESICRSEEEATDSGHDGLRYNYPAYAKEI